MNYVYVTYLYEYKLWKNKWHFPQLLLKQLFPTNNTWVCDELSYHSEPRLILLFFIKLGWVFKKLVICQLVYYLNKLSRLQFYWNRHLVVCKIFLLRPKIHLNTPKQPCFSMRTCRSSCLQCCEARTNHCIFCYSKVTILTFIAIHLIIICVYLVRYSFFFQKERS